MEPMNHSILGICSYKYTGRIETVRILLDNGASVDQGDRNRDTALIWAVTYGSLELKFH